MTFINFSKLIFENRKQNPLAEVTATPDDVDETIFTNNKKSTNSTRATLTPVLFVEISGMNVWGQKNSVKVTKILKMMKRPIYLHLFVWSWNVGISYPARSVKAT